MVVEISKFISTWSALKKAVASKWVKMWYFLLAKSYLKGLVNHMSKHYEPAITGASPKKGYACNLDIHLCTLSKFWGRFSQLQNSFTKKNRTQSVFMLQRWIAYKNIAEGIRNRNWALDFSFSAMFFFVIRTWSRINVEK